MSATADGPADAVLARRLGIVAGQVVQEFGWDDDVDDDLRESVEQTCGSPLEDEDSIEVADVVLLWFRDGDGDLVDVARRQPDQPRRGRRRLAAHPQARPARPRRARRHRGGGAHRGPARHLQHQRGPRLVGHASRLPEGPQVTAHPTDIGIPLEGTVPEVGTPAPDFRLHRPARAGGVARGPAPRRRRPRRAARLLPVRVLGHLHRRAVRDPRRPRRPSPTTQVQVVGISCDPKHAQRAWADARGLQVPAAQRLLAPRRGRASGTACSCRASASPRAGRSSSTHRRRRALVHWCRGRASRATRRPTGTRSPRSEARPAAATLRPGACSSVGQSTALTPRVSPVRARPGPPTPPRGGRYALGYPPLTWPSPCRTSSPPSTTPTPARWRRTGTRSAWSAATWPPRCRRSCSRVDVTAAVVDEALEAGADLVVAHHPLLLRAVHGVGHRHRQGPARAPAGQRRLRAVHRAHQRRLRRPRGLRRPGPHHRPDRARAAGRQAAGPAGPARRPRARATRPTPWSTRWPRRGPGGSGQYARCAWTDDGHRDLRAGTRRAAGRGPGRGAGGAAGDPRGDGGARAGRREAVLAAMRRAHPYEEPAFQVLELAPWSSPRGPRPGGDACRSR